MKFYAQIDLKNRLVPCTEIDDNLLRKISRNKTISIEIKKERNVNFHRKFFVLINLLFENQETYISIDDYRKDLLISSGFYTERTDFFTGEIRLEAKSISFSKMDDLEFTEVYKKVIDKALKFIPMEKEMLLETIEQYF